MREGVCETGAGIERQEEGYLYDEGKRILGVCDRESCYEAAIK